MDATMKRTLLIAATVLLTAAIITAPALAESATGHGVDAQGGHEKPALLHWDFGAALWSIAVFVVLLIVLRIAAWKPILNGLTEREAFIRNSLDDAKHEREEAGRLLEEYQVKLNEAQAQAAAVVEESRRDAEETRKRLLAEAKGEAQAAIDRAKRDIELARNDAVQRLHSEAVALATTVAGKMIQRELQPGDHEALINESLAELSGTDN